MCRCTDYDDFRSGDKNLLKIKAFFIRFSGLDYCTEPLYDSLTLLYPPRINGTTLEVSGSKVRPDLLAFVTLHRIVNVKTKKGEAIYGSRERVWAENGVRFEVYSRKEKVLKGILRKDDRKKWKLECKCAIERWNGEAVGGDGAVADVCVAVDGGVPIGERVEMIARKRGKNRTVGFDQLQEIPEEKEGESELDGDYCCICGESNDGGLQGRCDEDCGGGQEVEMDKVSWAFDVGLWVMCFGVGYLVSKASAKSLRRMRLL